MKTDDKDESELLRYLRWKVKVIELTIAMAQVIFYVALAICLGYYVMQYLLGN
jgi:hypothetical protein